MLTFVHMSDTHFHPDPSYTNNEETIPPIIGTKALVDAVNNLPFTPDFILHTGDVVYDPLPNIYTDILPYMNQLKAPVHYLVGNHDEAQQLQRELLGIAQPQPEFYYTLVVNGVQVICLDSNGLENPEFYTGLISETQLAWLDDLLSQPDERPLIIAVHHNPIKTGVPWLDNTMMIENGERLHHVLLKAKSRLRAVLFGHIHQNLDIYRDGILYASTTSSWKQFISYPIASNTSSATDFAMHPGFSVVQITQDHTFIRRHAFIVPPNASSESG